MFEIIACVAPTRKSFGEAVGGSVLINNYYSQSKDALIRDKQPMQVLPSFASSFLYVQPHSNEPIVLKHKCEQSELFSLHSLMSGNKIIKQLIEMTGDRTCRAVVPSQVIRSSLSR